MREKRNFGERAKLLPSDEARKKYFLVYEGKHHFTTFKFVIPCACYIFRHRD